MNMNKKLEKINEKIATIRNDRSQVVAEYHVRDESVQAELRLSASWAIRYPVDEIGYPKNLAVPTIIATHPREICCGLKCGRGHMKR